MSEVPAIAARRISRRDAYPVVVLGPSLGTSAAALWTEVAALLHQAYDIVWWDLPGHGQGGTATGFSMADLAAGVLSAVDELVDRQTPFVYAGDSVGGAVGLELLLTAPDRVARAVLMCTGARIGSPDAWAERAALVRKDGTAALVAGSIDRWFGPGFAESAPDVVQSLVASLSQTDGHSYAAVCEALAGFDVRHRLGEIDTPVTTVAGSHDTATPPAALLEIARGVQHSFSVVLDGVAHLPPAERPREAALAISGFASGSHGSPIHL